MDRVSGRDPDDGHHGGLHGYAALVVEPGSAGVPPQHVGHARSGRAERHRLTVGRPHIIVQTSPGADGALDSADRTSDTDVELPGFPVDGWRFSGDPHPGITRHDREHSGRHDGPGPGNLRPADRTAAHYRGQAAQLR